MSEQFAAKITVHMGGGIIVYPIEQASSSFYNASGIKLRTLYQILYLAGRDTSCY